MKNSFNLFGFKINTRKFILTMVITFAVVIFLIGVDILWYDVSWYGILIGVAFILAVVIASALAKERGIYKDAPYDAIWLIFPLAILGARVFYVINSLHEFDSFLEMVKIWEGGLSIFGGIVGGVIGGAIFCTIKKINFLKAFDIAAPVILLGQAIGRWGNFINKEVFGLEITNAAFHWFPFGVNINGTWHLATFFYESVINLIGFFVLLYLLRKTKKVGFVAFTYCVWYGVVRLVLESLRSPEFILHIPGTTVQFSSLFSLFLILVGAVGHIVIFIKNKKQNHVK